jgi:hypothetical protein
MKPALTTWADLAVMGGNVLLVINSPADADREVSAACEHFAAIGAVLHAVAAPLWRPRLATHGIPPERTLFTVDDQDDELELNYFLETEKALAWIWQRQFAVIAGSAPHNLYNEEIKDIFEARVSVFLRTSVFVAHALPARYLYVFDLAGMFSRLGRGVKLAQYDAATRNLIGECYDLWRAGGSPTHSDDADFSDVMAILTRHLGPVLVDFDERSPIPLMPPSGVDTAAAGVVVRMGGMIQARDEALNLSIGAATWREMTLRLRRMKRWLAAAVGRSGRRTIR